MAPTKSSWSSTPPALPTAVIISVDLAVDVVEIIYFVVVFFSHVCVYLIDKEAMLKFNSKSDVNQECKCIIRLLDDVEVIECEIQVT